MYRPSRFSTLALTLLSSLVATSALAQNIAQQADVVVAVPYSQKTPEIPHPIHEGAYTTLKAYVRYATCGSYTACWNINRNGSFDDDACRNYGNNGLNRVWEIGRTFLVPNVDASATMNVSVQVRNNCNGGLTFGTYRMYVYNWTPADDPRQWTAEQLEILQVEAVDEGMWYMHRNLTGMAGSNENSIRAQSPWTEATGMWLWLYNINGHLPAYPPGTYNTFGQPVPNGFIEENARRWAVDPYAETALRLANDLVVGAGTVGVNAVDEDNTHGFDIVNGVKRDHRINRLAGTTDGQGAYSSRGTGVYQMGINAGGVATVLASLAGTRIQIGPLAGNLWEWFGQQMVDFLGQQQIDYGSGYGSWYYHDVPHADEWPPNGNIARAGQDAHFMDLSTTQWAFVGLDGVEETGSDFNVIVNNRHKYRIAEQLVLNQTGDGGGCYANNYSTPDLKLTGGSLLGSRWLGFHNFQPGDASIPFPGYSRYSASQFRSTYDRYIAFTVAWWGQRRVHGTHWLDGLWSHGDYLCGDTSGIYTQPRCGNTYGIYSHQKAYRTGLPLPPAIGARDWNREFSVYYIRAMERPLDVNNPWASYEIFGRIVDDYCDIWGVTCGYGPGYMGAVMGYLVLTPTIFHPKPEPLGEVQPGVVNAGCQGGNSGNVTFDHAKSFHPNFAERIVRFDWDVDATNGLWWINNGPTDFTTPGADGVVKDIFEYKYLRAGQFTATLRVVDGAGENKTTTVQVTVNPAANSAPTAQAGTPYVIEVGDALQLAGAANDVNLSCGDTITVGWDLNNDGNFSDSNRADALIPFATVQALPRGVANPVHFRVTDAAGLTQTSSTTLTIFASAPTANIRALPNPARCGETVLYDGSASSVPNINRRIVRYEWDVDNLPGYEGVGSLFEKRYEAFGQYTANLRVTDDRDRTATAQTVISVNLGNQAPVARISRAQYVVLSGDAVILDATGSYEPNDTCGDRIVSYQWDVNGNGLFNDAVDGVGVTMPLTWDYMRTRMRWPASQESGLPSNLIRLQVTDTFGLTHIAESSIIIYDADPVPAWAQSPDPAPINVRSGLIAPFLDGRASTSPIRTAQIVDWDWDLNDDGNFETENVNAVRMNRTLPSIPQIGEPSPEIYVRLRVRDSLDRTVIRRGLINVSLPPAQPTADADPSDVPEPGYNILLGEGLTLNGAASFDPDSSDFGDFVEWYRWDLNWREGTPFSMDREARDMNSDAVEAVMPLTVQQLAAFGIATPGRYLVKLQVQDTTGMRNEDIAPIIIHPVSPIARLTADALRLACNQAVILDGRASGHPHPSVRISQYEWDLDEDGQFDDAVGALVQTRFARYGFGGTETIRLRVTDSLGGTAVASLDLTVDLGNEPANVVAGGNRAADGTIIGPYVVAVGEPVTLSPLGTADPNTDCGDAVVRYQWDFKNNGSYEFDRADATPIVLTPQLLTQYGMAAVGRYDIRLRVTDRFAATAEQIVPLQIVVGPTAIATATPNRTNCQAMVTFDASASSSDGPVGQGFDLVDFAWDLDNDGQFDDANGVRATQPAFALPDAQANVTMRPRVRVRDASNREAIGSTTVTINPQNLPPVANAGGPYNTGPVGASFAAIRLDGRASYDPDAPCDALTVFKWDIDGDNTFGAADGEPEGATVDNFTSPLWRPNTTQTVRLKVCDMRNTCSAASEADIQIRAAAPPLGEMTSPLLANAACIGRNAFNVTFRAADPSGRPTTATVNIAGQDVASQNLAIPANGTYMNATINVNPANIPEGRHFVNVILRNNAGGVTAIDSGGRLVFDRTNPALAVGNQLVANTCYSPAAIPRPLIQATDNFDGSPVLVQNTVQNACQRTLTVSATDACGNSTSTTRQYFVAEQVPVVITGVDEGALVNSARVNWQIAGPAQCVPRVTAAYTRNGGASAAYVANNLLSVPGSHMMNITVSDCANQTRPFVRRFTINAPPVAVPIPAGHPSADPARANAYRVRQGDVLIVDASESTAPEDFDRIVTYGWDWDANGTTDAVGRTATFPTPTQGIWNGRLTVTDSIGATGTATFRVTVDDVSPVCVAGGPYVIFSKNDFTADGRGSRPGAVNEPITRYSWSWDDGTPNVDGATAVHQYRDSGNYFLKLTCYDQDSNSISTVRADIRDVSPILIAFHQPEIIYESIPMEFSVDAIPALENDPITAYEWDFGDDNRAEYRGLDKATIVHIFRELGRSVLAIRIYDLDTRAIRKFPIDAREATLTVMLPHVLRKAQGYIASGQFMAAQVQPLLDLGPFINRGLWGERNNQRGVTLLALDMIIARLVQAQVRGVDFGEELWSMARQLSRELARMETEIRSRAGIDLRDPDLVQARALVVGLEQYRQAAWEVKVRSPGNAAVAIDQVSKAHDAYYYLRHFEYPLRACDAAALGRVSDPVTRHDQWNVIKNTLGADLLALRGDVQRYVDAGMQSNDPGPDRGMVQAALGSITEAAAVGILPLGRICGAGQNCVSEAQEARYATQLRNFDNVLNQLAGSGAYTRLWRGLGGLARQCRYDLGIHQVVDANANGIYVGGFPGQTYDIYWFQVPGESESIRLETSTGRNQCSTDTRLTIMKVNPAAKVFIRQVDDISLANKCSVLATDLATGRYEVKVDRSGVNGVDLYNLLVTHVRTDGCGDRRVTLGEECDDGGLANDDGCSAVCRIEPTIVQAGGDFQGTVPDGGFNRYAFSLDRRRTMTALVHDGAQGCSGDSRMTLYRMAVGGLPQIVSTDDDSGPGPCSLIVQQLDAGDYEIKVDALPGVNLPPYVLSVTFAGACGDLTIDPGEGCDDGNRLAGDGCTAVCTAEADCGDSVLDSGEQCDDGNRANGDACDLNCRNELGAVCGNGRVEAGEGCDDANRLNGDGCSALCAREARCGNRIVDGGETCDDGNVRLGDGCNTICQVELPCGDTRVGAGEQCDDGNAQAGDGCSDRCLLETVALLKYEERKVGRIIARGANYYAFKVDHTSNFYADSHDGSFDCTFDTQMALFRKGANGAITFLVNEFDSGVEACARFARLVTPGEYVLRVDVRNGLKLDAYTLDYRLGSNMVAAGNFNGSFPVGGDDMFFVQFATPRHLRAETTGAGGVCPGDTLLTLRRRELDGTRRDIASNDNHVGECSLIDLDLPTGNYEVVASGPAAIDSYVLRVAIGASIGSCGNMNVDAAESCDDGNLIASDGCDSQCRLECGNGRLNLIEACDDGNRIDGDGCDATCHREGVCGNAALEPGEACDDGNLVAGDGCESNCSLRNGCGNGVLGAGETCDDANFNNGDGCDVLCSRESFTVEKMQIILGGALPSLQSDVFHFTTEDDSVLRAETSNGRGACPGNTKLTLFEVVDGQRLQLGTNDDGGVAPPCSLLTQTIPRGSYQLVVTNNGPTAMPTYSLSFRDHVDVSIAGGFPGGFNKDGNDIFNAVVAEAGRIIFETSDGNGGCPADTMATLTRRGSPVVLASDDNNGPGSCSRIDVPVDAGDYDLMVAGRNGIHIRGGYATRISFARCGDDVVNPGEQCDDGNLVAGDGCDATCRVENLCGNGRVNAGEQCDDGNRVPGDGCSSECRTEILCGNGFINAGEGCDDGNVRAGDGCSEVCQVEPAACGNGRREGAEQCDDGNNAAGDGCSANCLLESFCGNRIVEGLEHCDDGNAADNDGCSAACTREFFPISTGRYLNSSTLSRDNSDTYRFRVDHTSALVVETQDGVGGCAGIDTEIVLNAISPTTGLRSQVALDNDAGLEFCSLLARSITAREYEVVVRGRGGAPVPGYLLKFRVAVVASANGIYLGGTVENGSDLYEARAANATRFTFTTHNGAGGCPADTMMNMYRLGADRVRVLPAVAESDDEGPGTCSMITRFQVIANTYYEIEVTGKNGITLPTYRFQTQIVP